MDERKRGTVDHLVDEFGFEEARSAGRDVVLMDDEEAVDGEALGEDLVYRSVVKREKSTESEAEQQIDHGVHVEDEQRRIARRASNLQEERNDLVAEVQIAIHIGEQADLDQFAKHLQIRRHPFLLDQRLYGAVEALVMRRLHEARVPLLGQPQQQAQSASAERGLRGEERQHRDERLLHARLQNHLLRQLRARQPQRPRGARRQHGPRVAVIARRLGNAQLVGEMARSLRTSQGVR